MAYQGEVNKKSKLYTWCAGACVLLFCLGLFFGDRYGEASIPKTTQVRDTSTAYPYIEPLILVDNADSSFPNLDSLKSEISTDISSAESAGEASDVSVYFRNMSNGQWTGVNEDDTYAPSSMLKVGILMAYLKIAETDPDVLNQEIAYTPTSDSGQYFKPAHQLAAGEYTARDLLIQMITESDNDALTALNNAHPQELVSLFNDLDIPYPTISSPKDFMSPELYSRLFRALYNATYLPDVESEQALTLLMQTGFTEGLVSGVPTSTPIAHKFGEQTNTDANGNVTSKELHDCGIVYAKDYPYFLCVMTKGQDFPTLEKIISDISKTVSDYVSSKNS